MKTGAYQTKTLQYFLGILLFSGLFLTGTVGLIYHLEAKDYLRRQELEESASVKLQAGLILSDIETIISDLLFLTRQNELLRVINFDEGNYRDWISREYFELSRRKKIYDQIRYIDAKGNETVRVNYNNGDPEIVSKNKLQFKGDRYYFKQTLALGSNEIYISPFDLNVENGEIEKPLKPMIRFGTPVFDKNAQKTGILLLNYLGSKMLVSLEKAGQFSLGNPMLLNRDGFWLLSPRKEDEWGFMIPGRQDKNFSKQFPAVWKEMTASDTCQVLNSKGLFTSVTVYPLKQGAKGLKTNTGGSITAGKSMKEIQSDAYFWKLVSHVPGKDLNSGVKSLRLKLVLMGMMLFLFSSGPSWMIARAIVRRRLHQVELYRSANYDRLTDLPNRSMFLDRLGAILSQSRRYDRKFALLFIDLDGFKSVNDTLGHDAGDQLLIRVAKRLKDGVRESDTVARLGGDEFTVIFSTIELVEDAEAGASKIIQRLSRAFRIKDQDVQIGASIGVSIYPDHGADLEQLLKKADNAMYRAKKEGKNDYRLSAFNP